MERASLERLDRQGYRVLNAVTYVGGAGTSSLANPQAFICADGATYWLKSSAQQGLAAELIAGRLAARVSAGPVSQVIWVPPEALPPSGVANHLQGLVVGSRDVRDSVNARELGRVLPPDGSFDVRVIDGASRARVVVFQTWVGASDSQVLVELMTGRVHSIDHGDCFGSLASPTALGVIVTDIPGVSGELGRSRSLVLPAIEQIETVTNDEILQAVAGVPSGESWQSDVTRRLEIAQWLAARRDCLREVVLQWTT